jgi:hypothetical protein
MNDNGRHLAWPGLPAPCRRSGPAARPGRAEATGPCAIIGGVAVVGYTDLFAAGLGFDITGAWLVAKGLQTKPDQYAGRMTAAGNTFAAYNARAAEDFADSRAGVAWLLVGFGLQAIGYALSIGGVSDRADGICAGLIAVGFTLAAVGIAAALARLMRWHWVRGWLIDLARFDRAGNRHDDPRGGELLLYARVLGRTVDEDFYGGDAMLRHARRVWGVDRVRGDGPDGPDSVLETPP